MSQFTNWLIETHPEYVKGSRILEQSGAKKIQGAQAYNIMHPDEFKEALEGRFGDYDKYKIAWKKAAKAVANSYRLIEENEFNLTAKEVEKLKASFEKGNEWTEEDVNEIVSKAKLYWLSPSSTFLDPRMQTEASKRKNSMYYIMVTKDWEWQYLQGPVGVTGYDSETRAVLVINKLSPTEKATRTPPGGTPPVPPGGTPPGGTPPVPGAGAPTDTIPPTLPPAPGTGGAAPGGAAPGGATASGRPAGSLWDDDYKERMKQLAKTRDAFVQKQAEIEQREKIELDKRKKEALAKAAAGGAGGAGGAAAVGAGRAAGRGAGAAGAGAGAGAAGAGGGGGGAAPGAWSPDEIFGKEPEKVNPLTRELERFQIKNVRKNLSNSMTKVVNHFDDSGLEVYIRGGNLFVLDASQKEPTKAVLYNAMLDNTNPNMEAPIWKQLWKASLQSNIKIRLGGKDLQQILGEMGSKALDSYDSPDDMKTAELYRGKPEVYDPNYMDRDSSARFHNKKGN